MKNKIIIIATTAHRYTANTSSCTSRPGPAKSNSRELTYLPEFHKLFLLISTSRRWRSMRSTVFPSFSISAKGLSLKIYFGNIETAKWQISFICGWPWCWVSSVGDLRTGHHLPGSNPSKSRDQKIGLLGIEPRTFCV